MSTPLQHCKQITPASRFLAISFLAVVFAALLIGSGRDAGAQDNKPLSPQKPVEAEAKAEEPQKDWRKELGVFRIGVIAGSDASTMVARMEPFRLSIEETLNMRVEIFPARNYRALIEAIEASRVEYAIMSSVAFATTFVSCKCAEPLVLPRASDGTFGYQPIVITRSNAGSNLASLNGKDIVSTITVSSPIGAFIVSRLLADGLKEETIATMKQSKISGEDALDSFIQEKHNALLGWSSLSGDPANGYSRGILRLIATLGGKKGANNLEQLRVIWKGPLIPHRPHVVRKLLAPEAKKLLRAQLLKMFENDPVAYDSVESEFGGGYIAARQGQFTLLADFISTLSGPEEQPVAE